ncbi:MAG: hypothetical protein GC166_03365 [Alphaproteobacteria bacterium]|nr:hypothetical protein [Alphaproteobacteria bacterium]
MENLVAGLAFAATAAFLFWPKVRNNTAWQATVTPLASIIGSGFLISLPLLADTVGGYATLAMMVLVAIGYAIGGAIRFNILNGEKLFDAKEPKYLFGIERLSHAALIFAYVISVTYYLSLLAAFLMKGIGVQSDFDEKFVTTAALAFIGIYGYLRGLHALEALEEYAVSLKLAVIAAVLAALVWLNGVELLGGTWKIAAPFDMPGWHDLRVVFGLLIVVQGFETSRFLKGVYEPKERVRTMRYAQWLSAAIYLAFFVLAMTVAHEHSGKPDIAGVVGMMSKVASILAVLLVGGAIFAQASAAIADTIGGAGLSEEASEGTIKRKYAYPLIGAFGIVLVWSANILDIVALASRAFAGFYALQCLVAAFTAQAAPNVKHRWPHTIWFAALGLLALGITILGIPAEGGG